MGRRCRRRLVAALRRADGLRRTARRLSCDARRASARVAGTPRRRHRRRPGVARVPPRAADARAAHPPREGDVQHLHGAGAAGGDGEHVRRLSRPRRTDDHRAPRPSPDGDPPRGPPAARRRRAHRRLLRHADHRRRARPCGDPRPCSGGEGQPASRRRDDARRVARRDDDARRCRPPVAHLRWRRRAVPVRRDRRGDAGRATRGAGACLGVPHPPGVPSPSLGNADAAVPACARGPRSRARSLDDPAGVVHDEAQCDVRDAAGDVAGIRRAASVRPAGTGAGLSGAHRRPRENALRDHRLRRRVAAAERRLAGRVRGPADDRGVPPLARRGAPERLPDSGLRARHQSRLGADGGHACRGRRVRRRRQRRLGRPVAQGGAACARARRPHGDLSVDARRVRAGHRGDLRDRACARRAGLRRRRQPERARGRRRARPFRRRRFAPQPAQDVLHPARRRRPGRGAGGVQGAPGAFPSRAPRTAGARRRDAHRPRQRGAVRVGVHPADLVDVHRDDGWQRSHRRDRVGDPRGELRREAAGAALSGALQRSRRPRRARVHPRPAAAEGHRGGRGRGRREAPDRLRLPRADDELPGRRNADGRADRKRIEAGARPLRRRDDRDPRGDFRDRSGTPRPRRQSAQACAPSRARGRGGRLAARVRAHARRVSGRRGGTRKVLAARRADRQRLRRSQSVLQLRPGRRRRRRRCDEGGHDDDGHDGGRAPASAGAG